MRVIAEIAVDREPEELVAAFVKPLDAVLQDGRLGRVTGHSIEGLLIVRVRITVSGSGGYDRILQFFAEADAPDKLAPPDNVSVLLPETVSPCT